MEYDESQQFNERLNHWVASQGFWFQLRYSLMGSGLAGTKGFHLMGLGLRLMVFLVLVMAVGGIYLMTRVGSEEFAKGIEERIGTTLHADEVELKGIARNSGSGVIPQLAATGEATFFSALEARNVRFKLGLLHGIIGKKDPGTVMIGRLEVDLQAGAADPRAAERISSALFEDRGGDLPTRFDIEDATLRWGYGATTRGGIQNSRLRIQKMEEGWKLVFEGGTFSQNWLRNLEIVSLVASCSPQGIDFEEALFKVGQGTVKIENLRLVAGERPQVEGRATLKRLPLDSVLPVVARSFLEGSISGVFDISGSTNTPEGIGFEGTVMLEEGDLIRLKDRVHLLRALSVVVAYHNYRKVDFRQGSFKLKTGGGTFEIQDLALDGKELMTLEGNIKGRPPTEDEQRQTKEQEAVSPLFASELLDDAEVLSEEDAGFTLRRAAEAADASKSGSEESGAAVFDEVAGTLAVPPWEAQEQNAARALRFEGALEITLPPDAFERAPILRDLHGRAAGSGRVPLKVPVEGTFYELTLGQAETIYSQGTR